MLDMDTKIVAKRSENTCPPLCLSRNFCFKKILFQHAEPIYQNQEQLKMKLMSVSKPDDELDGVASEPIYQNLLGMTG